MPAKKTTKTTKKTTTKKAPAKKTTTKKTPAKKTTKKAAPKTAPKEKVVKQSVQKYIDVINWKKGEAHAMDWLFIEINAGDLLTEIEAGVDNLSSTCKAMLETMLEGDCFVVEPKKKSKVDESLTVRYYCDNLSEERRKYFQ